jgi:hypothetical protein
MERNVWRKSSRSGSQGACTEVRDRGDAVEVRDSKDPHGPVLTFTPDGWAVFIEGIKRGDFDLA